MRWFHRYCARQFALPWGWFGLHVIPLFLKDVNELGVQWVAEQLAGSLLRKSRVLEVASGGGLLFRPLLSRGLKRLEAVDASSAMISYCSVEYAEEIAAGRIVLHEASDLPFAKASIDVVVCCNAMHVFADQRQMLRDMASLLAPRGLLAIAVKSPERWFREKDVQAGRNLKVYALALPSIVEGICANDLGDLLYEVKTSRQPEILAPAEPGAPISIPVVLITARRRP